MITRDAPRIILKIACIRQSSRRFRELLWLSAVNFKVLNFILMPLAKQKLGCCKVTLFEPLLNNDRAISCMQNKQAALLQSN